MIESIKISNVATFDGAGVRIDNLNRANFIYGANGTGKTTISKLLNEEALPGFSKCSVVWRGGLQLETLIYNKDFRDRNFGKGEIDGVFTLGEATKDEKEAIEQMVTELQKIKAEGSQKKETLEKLNEQKKETEDSFRDAAWIDVYKKHEVAFKDAFAGVMKKEAFRDKLITQAATNKANLKPFDELEMLASTIFGKAPEELSPIGNLDYARLLEIEADAIWAKKIIGKADIEIAKLIQHLNMNDWVNEGRSYLHESAVCPFCQKETITESFRKQLDEYFDQAFKEDTQRVKSLSSEYSIATQNLLNLLGGLESKEKENPNSKLNLESLTAYIKIISAQLRSNEEFTKSKDKEPSRSFTLTPLKEPLDSIGALIDSANNEVAAHNKVVDNYTKEKANLVEAVWRFLVEEYSASIAVYTNTIAGRQKGIHGLEKKKKELLTKYNEKNQKIKDANKNVTSVQPSVDEINNILKAYGFLNFEIVPSSSDKNQYQIQREDGSIAESTLSEGEITFITFLYFLQLAKGGLTEDAVSNERVLVVDDPISSLDSNVLFVVSSLIKEILKAVRADRGVIKQIILLTHNVYFHKEVSYSKAKEDRNTFFWILRKKNGISTIEPCLMSNPIHNSYELLWRELKKDDENDCITIQNTMRRIIENYFKILGGYHYDVLIKSFTSIEEQQICRSMVCWINDGSHTIPDDLFIQSHDGSKEKYFDVFEKIFCNTDHHAHFRMMMGIGDEAQEIEGGEAPENLEVART